MYWEVVRLSWRALWERKGRTIGAIIGVVIAFTALSYALLLGQTFKDAVNDYFMKNFQLDSLYVTGVQFTDADVNVLRAIPGVEHAVPIAAARGLAKAPGQQQPLAVTIYGISPAHAALIIPETALYEGSLAIGGNLALVGYYVAFDRSTGERRLDLGAPLTIQLGRRTASVQASAVLASGAVGVLDTLRGVVVDIALFRQLAGSENYNFVLVRVKDTTLLEKVAADIRAYFPSADIISPLAVLQTFESFFTSFQLFLGLIAGVSTVITALWLYDTMSISVVHRTKEIGVMRALGYKRRHIMILFLAEALLIAAVGIALGAAALVPLAHAGIPTPGQTSSTLRPAFHPPFAIQSIELNPVIIAAAATLVAAVNLAGAALPAYRASRINIVSALRYE